MRAHLLRSEWLLHTLVSQLELTTAPLLKMLALLKQVLLL